ncbi:MAG: hypothetical protein ACI4UO_04290, partial [Paludibacteraceae bacterium]
HLPWEQASYGYVYPSETPAYKRRVQKLFPYYGEYTLLNKVNEDWAKGEQHGGAANGYCLYVDGTEQPGLVASITTDVQICSGQQMFFSAWVCNPCPVGVSGTEPIFRFNVQGRNNGGDWEDVGQFFAGKIAKGGAWYQVMFPLVSEHDYDESRVSIYDFAATNSGNDFLVDDICLFASRLPLQAYQATTTCAEDSNEVILSRIDYTRLTGDWAGKMIYYQVYNTVSDTAILAKYYRYGKMDTVEYPVYADTTYGYICIPCNEYDPAKTNDPNYRDEHLYMHGDESKLVYSSVTQFIDTLLDLKNKHGRIRAQKAYISVEEQGEERYVLYIGEIIPKDRLKNTGKYEVRMAASVKDLANPECALQAELPLNHQSEFLFNGKVAPEEGVCANNLYPIEVVVTNQYEKDGDVKTVKAKAFADWLVADRADDCFYVDSLDTPANRALADEVFKTKFGYERGIVEDAIRSMRQLPTESDPNPNHDLSDAAFLQKTLWLDNDQIAILQDLAAKGYLLLRQQTTWCYMTSQDTMRYWIYPISGTAQAEVDGKSITLNDCNSPSYMRICVRQNNYHFSLSPLPKEEMNEQQRGQLPVVRVSASEANTEFKSTVGELSSNIAGLVPDSCIVTTTNDSTVLKAMENKTLVMKFSNTLDIDSKILTISPLSGNTATMRAGYEYTLRVK